MEIRRLTEAQLVISAGYGNPQLSRIDSPEGVRERQPIESDGGSVGCCSSFHRVKPGGDKMGSGGRSVVTIM